eukprot:gene23723-9275_t
MEGPGSTAADMELDMRGETMHAISAMEGPYTVLEDYAGGREDTTSLMEDLGVVSRRDGSGRVDTKDDLGLGLPSTWGGSGQATGQVDYDEQEALLHKMGFPAHKVKKLMGYQKEAVEELKKTQMRSFKSPKLQRVLRISGGTHQNRPIVSSMGNQTRPMMEKAIFNMIQSQCEDVTTLPEGSRWLDLFAGTGSVGLEALSRGCAECHFVEMDKWLCKNVLGKNLQTFGFNRRSVVHTFKCEDFLKKALQVPRFAGGAFDFISMCPPYLLVSYPELFGYLEKSALIHPGTIMFVEYPKQLSNEIPKTVGPLVQVRDRKYGRTRVVVYGPAESVGDGEEVF